MRWLLLFLSVAAAVRAAEPPRLGGGEAPAATDLLRAETLAGQAAKRLDLPARTASGWKRGGGGWTTRKAPSRPDTAGVTIRVTPPRRRR